MGRIPAEVPDPKSQEVPMGNPVTDCCVSIGSSSCNPRRTTGGKSLTRAYGPNDALLRHVHIDDVHIRTGQKLVIVRGVQL